MVSHVQVFGREQLGALMYGLQRATRRITLAIEKVEVLRQDDSSRAGSRSGSGMYQLRITGRHAFFLPALIR